MIYTKWTSKALKLCYLAHKDQVDDTGVPYVFHPVHLAEQMNNETATICALLHDLVEDTDYTFEYLKNEGFSDTVIEVLKLLTHDKSEDYFVYVKRISSNAIAKQVKLADLKHNSDLSRYDGEQISEYVLLRNEKYKKAIAMLEN